MFGHWPRGFIDPEFPQGAPEQPRPTTADGLNAEQRYFLARKDQLLVQLEMDLAALRASSGKPE